MAPRTSAGTARRQQIVDATIALLARDGLRGTTFTRIAREAGLSSPGLVSYHFDDKAELMASVMDHIVTSCEAAVAAAVEEVAGRGPEAELAAYVAAFVRYQDAHREQTSAVWRLMAALTADQPADHDLKDDIPVPRQRGLQRILREGQEAGAFRDFDVAYVGHALHGAMEGYRDWFVRDPDVDVEGFVTEMVELARRATEA